MADQSAVRVFSAMNAGRKILGVDFRIGLAAVVVGVLAMPIMHAVFRPVLIAIGVWIIGGVCEKRDPRFFDLLPLRVQLKDRYER